MRWALWCWPARRCSSSAILWWNDIPDIIARFQNLDAETDRKRTEQSFFVPKEEIAANGYDLSINKYKETEYVPVEYPSTTEILADLHELEMEITKGLAELEEMV